MKERGISVDASTQWLGALGEFVSYLCVGTDQPVLLELTINELATNAMRHGSASRCRLDYSASKEGWKMTLSDDGLLYDPLARVPNPMGKLREHGYGLAIINAVLEREPNLRFEYRRHGVWNHFDVYFDPRGKQFVLQPPIAQFRADMYARW
jgi:anti-sigma regulatory factor (Ser/Thr protein kinase)